MRVETLIKHRTQEKEIRRSGELVMTKLAWEQRGGIYHGSLGTAAKSGWYTVRVCALKGVPVTEEEFKNADIQQTFTFGPILIRDGKPLEIKDTSYHPRTAIGQLDDNRYVLLVAEGRMEGAKGMSLQEAQQIFLNLGCETAYNLDGGGSTSLYFQGKLINTPSDGNERSVVDMIYF